MKNKKYLILSIISFILGGLSFGIVVLFALFGGLICGKPFHIISGYDGPIPVCTSIFNTEFIWPFIIGICLLCVAIIFIITHKNNYKK